MWDQPPKDISLLLNKKARLENLYYIIDENGIKTPFKLNWMQKELDENRWYQMLILKSRQLGCTSFWAIDFLDDCFWQSNLSAGIIAHRREDAENIFKKKVKFAYDRMPEWTRAINSAKNDRVGELEFKNGSSYRVSTGFRSGTNQRLLISEFGKICADSPDIAKEIVTGSLNTVSTNQIVVIESTAEGREGYYYDFSIEAEKLALSKKKLTPMQKRFFFFPWYREPDYQLDCDIEISPKINEYIDSIEILCNVKISDAQRKWYQLKEADMKDSMKQEYPSTPKEAFEASNEGLYYGLQIAQLRNEGQLCKVPYQESSLVYVSFDIGYHDDTSLWFVQLLPGGVINVIDFYQYNGKGAKFFADYLKSKPYSYGSFILPHDADSHHPNTGTSWREEFEKLMKERVYVLERESEGILNGIQSVRSKLSRCYFDEVKCSEGIKALESYKKEWNDKLGCYRNSPLHDWSSHAADSFRYLCVAIDQGKIGGSSMSKEELSKVKMQAGFHPVSFTPAKHAPFKVR